MMNQSQEFFATECEAVKKKFYTKNGFQSRYALLCGYVDIRRYDNGINYAELSLDGCYHVKKYDKQGFRTAWLTFDSLTEARKEFMKKPVE